MKKYETIKRIDLMDRQSTTKHPQSRLQSIGRSSRKHTSRDQTEAFECFTDRSKHERINEFSMLHQDPGSQTPSKGNIRTFIRFKPFNRQDLMDSDGCGLQESGIDLINDKKVMVDQNLCYSFDRVFEPESSQRVVYEVTAKEIIRSFVNGFNGTIFAYGQTGSGKTYTMFGDQEQNTSGIIPLSIDGLFTEIQAQKALGARKVSLSCSMYEIYKEIICDLMWDSVEKPKEIKIKESGNGSVQIENLTIKQVLSKDELLEWISKGSELRKIRGTDINERSSRSHLILTLYLDIKLNDFESKVSKLNLVDLAGSEKVSKTKVSGQGLEEAIKINLSLSCLGNAIYALSKGLEHVPFRDSKLTRVLQESLSGNSITSVIVTCSMLASCKQETISSLKFANRIKTIKTCSSQNVKKMNEQGVNKFMYQTLKASFQSCEEKLEKIKMLVESTGLKMGKEDIIDAIKTIIYVDERSQNQFLTLESLPFETFRSPCKQESANYFQQTDSLALARDDSKSLTASGELQEHVKNLQSILMKQEKIIERQGAEIQRMRKEQEEKIAKVERELKKGNPKLKILKNNTNSCSANVRLKQGKSKSKELKNVEEKQILTFRTKYNDSNGKRNHDNHEASSLKEISERFNECLRQDNSYEAMEREIMMKQIKALGLQVNYWRKIADSNGSSRANDKVASIMNDISNQLAKQVATEEELLKKRLRQKETYIEELEKMVRTKIELKNDSPQESTEVGQQTKRKIELFTSPGPSRMMSRVNSAKQLTKL